MNLPLINNNIISNSINHIPTINKSDDNKQLRKQTNAFESLILQIVLDVSMKDNKNIFSDKNKPGDRIYQSMYRSEIAKQSAGSFGISQMLYNYLSAKEKS